MEARHKSMNASGEFISSANEQFKIINQPSNIPRFHEKFESPVGEKVKNQYH